MKQLIVVGLCPSESSPDDSAFHPETKSRQTVDHWIALTGIECEVIYLNIYNHKKKNNAPLSAKDINESLPALQTFIREHDEYKIVTVGKDASKAVSKLRIMHLACPHPSGRNRLLNSSTYVEQMIINLSVYLNM